MENIYRFQREMEANGNVCDLLIYADMGHGFFNYQNQEKNGMY